MNDTERKVTVYGVGTRAYRDTIFSGMVPGVVTEVIKPGMGYIAAGSGAGRVCLTVSKDHAPYKKGEKFYLSAHSCVPAKQLNRRNGRINTNYAWE